MMGEAVALECVTLRRAANSDRDAIVGLHSEGLALVGVGHDPTLDSDLEDVEGSYLKRGGEFLIVQKGDAVVAMGAFRRLDGRNAEIRRLRVASGNRRQGHGRAVLIKLLEEAAERGFRSIVVDISAEMSEARSLFESEGFQLEREGDLFGIQMFSYRKSLV
jgi:ribosomal protein S18 acetylase RimI-like enzyme